jgi:hypothetical protein
MEDANPRRKRKSESEDKEGSLLHSFTMAGLAFLFIVLSYQLFLWLTSIALGYETETTFGKVVSKPFENRYWSNARVLFMYALPSVAYLLLAAALAFYLLFMQKTVNTLYWFLFWCMVFSVFLISGQLTLSPFAAVISKGVLYQGIPVVTNWWGVEPMKLYGFMFLSFLLNIFWGIVSFRLVMQLSPSRNTMRSRSNQRNVVIYYFALPIVVLLPLALILAYPNSVWYILIMLLHFILWLPGLIMKTQSGYRLERSTVIPSTADTSYFLVFLFIISFVLTLVFL